MVARLLVVLLAGGTSLAGCGVPADSSPRSLPENLRTRRPVNVVCPPAALEPAPVDVWFVVRTTQPSAQPGLPSVEGRQLTPAPRKVPPQVCHVLLALLEGPDPDVESEQDYETAILGTGLLAKAPTAAGAVAKVVLRESFGDSPGADGAIALGQMVFTATEVEGIESVEFQLKSKRPVSLSLPSGERIERPLRRDDFQPVFPA